jgi:hypothetical protein
MRGNINQGIEGGLNGCINIHGKFKENIEIIELDSVSD